MMDMGELQAVMGELEYKDWVFHIGEDGDRCFLQVRFTALDVETMEVSWQSGRKWWISPHMTKSEVVQTALKAVLTAEEHEAREQFRYGGQRIFGPHIDVDVLWRVCEERSVRT